MIAVNNSWELAPWADCLYACDGKWWEHYEPAFEGLRVTQDPQAAEYGAKRVPGVDEPGISLNPLRIHFGNNSGYQAINLAMHFGARRIVLLGFDMDVSGGVHWHGAHGGKLANPTNYNVTGWRRRFAAAATDLGRAGVEVINCSRQTALECFPRARLEDVL